MIDDGWWMASWNRLLHVAFLSFIIQPSSFSIALAAESAREPSVVRGAGEVVKGLVVELPKGVLEGTVDGPVVVGTIVGLFGGAVRALQVTAAGLVEMAQGFHPFEERRVP